MRAKKQWSPGPGARITGVTSVESVGWIVKAMAQGSGICPDCGHRSRRRRHGWYDRRLQDLPVQGEGVVVQLRLSRWRCTTGTCQRQTFSDRLPDIAAPHARRTTRVSAITSLFGHSTAGRPGERLLLRLGMRMSDDTILRQLKRDAVLVGQGALGRDRRLELAAVLALRHDGCRSGKSLSGRHPRRSKRRQRGPVAKTASFHRDRQPRPLRSLCPGCSGGCAASAASGGSLPPPAKPAARNRRADEHPGPSHRTGLACR